MDCEMERVDSEPWASTVILEVQSRLPQTSFGILIHTQPPTKKSAFVRFGVSGHCGYDLGPPPWLNPFLAEPGPQGTRGLGVSDGAGRAT